MGETETPATQRLKVVFRQVDALLANEIDPLLVPLTKSNPQWHAKYRAARIIIDHPGGRTGTGNAGNGQGEAAPPPPPAAARRPDREISSR